MRAKTYLLRFFLAKLFVGCEIDGKADKQRSRLVVRLDGAGTATVSEAGYDLIDGQGGSTESGDGLGHELLLQIVVVVVYTSVGEAETATGATIAVALALWII